MGGGGNGDGGGGGAHLRARTRVEEVRAAGLDLGPHRHRVDARGQFDDNVARLEGKAVDDADELRDCGKIVAWGVMAWQWGSRRALAAINNQAARGENCRSRTVSRATGGQGWKLNRPSSRAALISGAHTWMREMSARRGKKWWGSRKAERTRRGGGGTRRRRRDAAARTRTGQRLGLHHERTRQQPLERLAHGAEADDVHLGREAGDGRGPGAER